MSELPTWLEGWLDWIALHPGWSLVLLALAAGIEGLFLIGLFIPGSVLMFAAGVLAANGYLAPWAAIASAALGAAIGDGCSYLLGRTYREDMPRWTARWQLLPHAEAFFRRRGGLGLILGRLIGPLRPFVPAVAGAAGYPPKHFVPMICLACLIWAVAYALPGMALGATLALLAEVLGRLSILLGLLVLGLYVFWRLISALLALGQVFAEPLLLRMIDWSHRHRRLGRLGPALADRDQPETPVLLACLGLALLLGLGGELLLRAGPGVIAGWNLALLDQLAGFRGPWVDQLGQILRSWGDPALVVALTVGSCLSFVLSGRPRESAHLLAGALGSGLLGSGLAWISPLPPSALSAVGTHWTQGAALGAAAGLAIVLAGILATHRGRRPRLAIYWSLGAVFSLVLLATLIQGVVLPDRALLLLLLTLLWASCLILGYRRHTARRTGPAPGWPHVVSITLCCLLIPLPTAPEASPQNTEDLLVRRPDRLNLLWTGAPEADLQALGWERQSDWRWTHLRAWLGQAPLHELPAAPVLLNGARPTQVWRREQEILRLWAQPGTESEASPQWVGQHGRLYEVRLLGQARLPLTRRSQWARTPPSETGLAPMVGWQQPGNAPLRLYSLPPSPEALPNAG